MELNPDTDADALRRYLLGAATPDEQEQIDLRLLADGAFYEEVSAAEDDLVDEYLAGRLAPEELEGFETIFLAAPERRRKLGFARAFRRRLTPDTRPNVLPHPPANRAPHEATPRHAPHDAPAGAAREAESETRDVMASGKARGGVFGGLGRAARAGLASVALVAVAGLVLLAVRATRQTTPAPISPAPDNTAARVVRPQQSPAARESNGARQSAEAREARDVGGAASADARPGDRARAGAQTFAVALKPGLTRAGDGETARVRIPAAAEFVRFDLLLAAAEPASYAVSVETFEGREVASLPGLAADTRGGPPAVVFELRAAALPPGDYRIRLSARRDGRAPALLPGYAFRVPKP